MSRQCPLCGKNKPEEALFCEDCAMKIRADYEIDLPEFQKEENIPVEEEGGPGNVNFPIASEAKVPEMPNVADTEEATDTFDASTKKPQKKPLLWIALAAVLLAGAFFVYNETIRKGNLERSAWEKALKMNSVEGYVAYMASHPGGARFEEAQAKLMSLKEKEAVRWEQLKTTGNITELRDFLQQYPKSPYASLVKIRIDSLSWVGALNTNTAEAYSDYILLAQSGDFKGDYLTLANTRREMLFQSYPVNETELDSLRQTVGGFYAALSMVDHDGMRRYLAPVVDRFFESGRAPRERIAGELLIAAARTQNATLQFVPDLSAVQYEKTMSDAFSVNVPLTKLFAGNGKSEQVTGYIVHMRVNPLFQITSIYETKPYPGAP